jgi:hypothetical protein
LDDRWIAQIKWAANQELTQAALCSLIRAKNDNSAVISPPNHPPLSKDFTFSIDFLRRGFTSSELFISASSITTLRFLIGKSNETMIVGLTDEEVADLERVVGEK